MRIIQSAAFKLTLWYLGIIMVLSLLFSIGLFRLSDDQLTSTASRQINAIERLPLPIEFQNQQEQYVQNLLNELDASRRGLIERLILLNVFTLLVGGGASYLLARRTLGPVQEAMEVQGRFTADASHELRTPLTAIRAEIEVALRDKSLSLPDAKKLLSSNLEEVSKLEALSSGLLRLSRFENSLEPSAVDTISLKDIFEGAIERHQGVIERAKVTLDVHQGDETVQGDKLSLIELIAILIDNAVKYSPKGSTLTLRSHSMGHTVTMSVADQGLGIKSTDIPHIFDRFYRADASRNKDRVDGYGLGLSIAKRITDLHHGTISVQSSPGEGSTFTIKLPARYEQQKSWLLSLSSE